LISVGQFPTLFGIKVPKEQFFYETLYELLKRIPDTQVWTFMIGLVSLLFLLSLRFLEKKVPKLKLVPGALIVLVITTLLSWALDLHSHGVQVVGTVPKGMPPVHVSFQILCIVNFL
jgi:SulP family sulfate permease